MYGNEPGPAAVHSSHYDQQHYGYSAHDGRSGGGNQYQNGLDHFGGAEPSYLKAEQTDQHGGNSYHSGQGELDAYSHSPYLTASSQGSYYPDNGSTPYSTPQMGSHGGSSYGSYGAHSASGRGGGGAGSGEKESASGNMAGFGARKFAEQQRKIEEYRERKERERYQQEALERQRAEWEWQQRQQAAEEEQRKAARAKFEEQERRRMEEAQRLLEEEQWRLQQQQQQRAFEQQQQHDEQQRRREQAQRSSPEHWNQQMDKAPSSQGHSSGYGSKSRAHPDEYSSIVDQTYRREPAPPQEDPYARYTLTQADYSSQRDTYKASSSDHALQVGGGNRGGAAHARKSMLLNTVDEELPKAKCADCGSQISFEQLALHRCVGMDRSRSAMSGSAGSSGKPSPLTLTINLPPEGAPHDGPSSAGSAGQSSRSPFLERYDGYTSSRSASNLSPNTEELDPYRNMPSSAPPLGATSFADAEEALIGAERKRQIAAQREAKKRGGPAVAAEVIVATMRFKEGAAKAKKEGGTLGRLKQQSAWEVDLKRQESSSSSVSSAQSSLLEADRTGFSRRARAGSFDTSGAQSATLTPSSSYDRFSNAQDSPAASSKSKTKPKMPEPRQERPTRSRSHSSDERGQLPSQEGRRPSQDDARSVSSSGAASGRTRKGSRKQSDVDLAGIETLMRDLQTPGGTKRPSGARRGTEADIQPSHSMPARRGTESDIRRGHSASGSTEEDRLRPPPKSKPSRSQTTPTTPELSYSAAHFANRDNGPTIKERRVKRRCAICDCSLSSSKTPFVERDGQYFCAKDYATRYLPRCRKCSQPVESNAVKSSDGALRGIFHRDCFTCFDCDSVFEEGTFYVFENSPYCAEHYHERNGTLCEGCGEGIEGQCKQTEGGERYHPHCLRCQFEGLTPADKGEFCQEPLDDFFVINGKRLCDWHAQRTQAHMKKTGRTVNAHKRRTFVKMVK